MRSYPIDSPEAAARIVAMMLLADGMPGHDELEALGAADVQRELGVTPARLDAVVRAYCEDLQTGAAHHWNHACSLDQATTEAMLDEVRDPHLRERLLALCRAVAQADGRITDGEAAVLAAAGARWHDGAAVERTAACTA